MPTRTEIVYLLISVLLFGCIGPSFDRHTVRGLEWYYTRQIPYDSDLMNCRDKAFALRQVLRERGYEVHIILQQGTDAPHMCLAYRKGKEQGTALCSQSYPVLFVDWQDSLKL